MNTFPYPAAAKAQQFVVLYCNDSDGDRLYATAYTDQQKDEAVKDCVAKGNQNVRTVPASAAWQRGVGR